jgi:membrane protein DedA with SNARE-associated domain
VIDSITPTTLLVLWSVVAFGSIIPIVPTGAAVSAAAVIAAHDHPVELLAVVVFGAAGAYCGDLVTYGALSVAGSPLARRLGWLKEGEEKSRLARLREQIEGREVRTLVLSRLVPAGRIPVLLVASLTGYPWLRYASAAVAATLLWSVFYALIGLLGGTVFPDTTAAIVVAMVVAVLASVLPDLVRRLRARSARE